MGVLGLVRAIDSMVAARPNADKWGWKTDIIAIKREAKIRYFAQKNYLDNAHLAVLSAHCPKVVDKNYYLDQFVGTRRAGKGIGLGFESEAHTQDITDGFFERNIRFKLGVRIDVGMHFEVNIVSV